MKPFSYSIKDLISNKISGNRDSILCYDLSKSQKDSFQIHIYFLNLIIYMYIFFFMRTHSKCYEKQYPVISMHKVSTSSLN